MSKARRALVGLALLAVGGAGVTAARRAEARALDRWAKNPDPMEGEPSALDGEAFTVEARDGARLSAVRAGAGNGPMAVLAHGITATVDEWAPVARRLVAGGMRVVAYDERGHGRSTAGASGFTLDALGTDLLDVLHEVAPRDAVLVGHSMGGIAIMSALAQDPATVNQARGVVLVATLARAIENPLTKLTGRLAATDIPPRLMRNERHGRVLARSGYGKAPSLSLLDGTRRNWMETPTATRAGFLSGLRGFDLFAALGSLERPAVVVCGDTDKVTPLAGNEAIAARLPHGTIAVAPGAGHVIIKEQPDVVAGHVLRLAGLTPPLV
jgi:pimeloyl-ACP methyl ester carboxylesterase